MSQQRFHQKLHEWYQLRGRHHLPWRQTEDPYAIWLSEVMLQQTQVVTVLDRFYFPFLKRFPDIYSLAEADLQDVLQLWQGLGYYNRARNLHKAAQQLVLEGRNTLPANPAQLVSYSGIGKNTAHAIAAFAFHEPVPIMEANVKRILCRIFALTLPSAGQLWSYAEKLLDKANPYDYNQAMMDLGAMVCTPKSPDCAHCPANSFCMGKEKPEDYPQKKSKNLLPIRRHSIFLLEHAGHYATRPRKSRFLHGLWEFPTITTEEKKLSLNGEDYFITKAKKLGSISHAYSHFELKAAVYLCQSTTRHEDWHWHNAEQIASHPLSRTEKKILQLLK